MQSTPFTHSTVLNGNFFEVTLTNTATAQSVVFKINANAEESFKRARIEEHMQSLTTDQLSEFFPKEKVVEKKEKPKEVSVDVPKEDPVKVLRKAKKDATNSSLSFAERCVSLAYVLNNTDFTKDEKGFIFKDFAKLVNSMGKDAQKALEKPKDA